MFYDSRLKDSERNGSKHSLNIGPDNINGYVAAFLIEKAAEWHIHK